MNGLRGPNAMNGLRGPNATNGLRGPNATNGLRGPNATNGGIPTSTTPERELEHVRHLARTAAQAAAAKGGDEVLILEVGAVLAICDAFVLASGRNARQVRTIAEEIEQQVRAAGGGSPLRVEGAEHARWVLLDYGDFVVHVFHEEVRRFYRLERLWKDAPRVEWEEAEAPAGS